MTGCRFHWKSENYVFIEGEMDGNSQFNLLFDKGEPALWLDFSGVRRVNSLGVVAWIRAVEQKHCQIHYVNMPVCVMEQFTVLPAFRGKQSDVGSFWAQYTCNSCRRDESVLLVVGRDIEPGLLSYEEGPVRKCTDCGRPMEFGHDPELFLSFLTSMPHPTPQPQIVGR